MFLKLSLNLMEYVSTEELQQIRPDSSCDTKFRNGLNKGLSSEQSLTAESTR